MTSRFGPVAATPYAWPFDGTFSAQSTALLCIDWQVDFCGVGGYVDRMGYDLTLTRRGLAPTARILGTARAAGLQVIHTREGHRADLSDCPPNKLWRSQQIGAEIGSSGPGTAPVTRPCGRRSIFYTLEMFRPCPRNDSQRAWIVYKTREIAS